MARKSRSVLALALSVTLALGTIPAPALAEMGEEPMGKEPATAQSSSTSSSAEMAPSVDDARHAQGPGQELSVQAEENPSDVSAATTDAGVVVTGDDVVAMGEGRSFIGDAPRATSEEGSLSSQQSIQYSQPQLHTKNQIRNFFSDFPVNPYLAASYKTKPSAVSPFAPGELSDGSVQNALRTLNAMRYVAGVGNNVTNNATYQQYAQAAALVNRANGRLNHSPDKPSGMADDLYQRGYTGSGSSNLAYGNASPATSILQYLDDLGANNSGEVGHRRWLLSSRLGQVGIGQVDSFNATYVSDSSDPSYVTDVAWPARVMPTGFMGDWAQWSFSTVTQNIGSESSITVHVVRRRDGRQWNLSAPDVTVNEVSEFGWFVGYDMNGCIVWNMPDVGGYRAGDVFDVTIRGDKSQKSYSVEFFDLSIFPDVQYYDWYYGVVNRAVASGLLSGYGTGNFGPKDHITRGQVAVMLWNMAGSPAVGAGAKTFPDVGARDYFYNAVRWASSKNVVSGYGNGRFGPNDNVTREELAAMLANYARSVKGRQVSGSTADYASMKDKDKVSKWAQASVGWCFRNNILSGSGGNVNPHGNAARAEAAKMVVFLRDMLG